jgi:hypothetical protein
MTYYRSLSRSCPLGRSAVAVTTGVDVSMERSGMFAASSRGEWLRIGSSEQAVSVVARRAGQLRVPARR